MAAIAIANANANAPSTHLLHILRSQHSLLKKPLLLFPAITSIIPKRLHQIQIQIQIQILPHPKPKPLFAPHSFSSLATHCHAVGAVDISEDDEVSENEEDEEGIEVSGASSDLSPLERKREERLNLSLSLSVKERKELASYANSLGKKLKSQLVGKSGVTPNVASSFIENLESNELLKIKIHRTCPGELDDVVKQLEEATGSVTVGQIGRTVIVYRPSLTKLKAEEKKKQARKVFLRRQCKPKLSKEQGSKFSRRR